MSLKVMLCQASFEVGNVEGNKKKILQLYNESKADLIVFPELSLSGYNCRDLFFSDEFMNAVESAAKDIQQQTNQKAILIGLPRRGLNGKLFNSAFVMQNGAIIHQYDKYLLPNYGMFDEKRYFVNGTSLSSIFECNGHKIHLMICEDLWSENLEVSGDYANISIIINASPYSMNKLQKRVKLVHEFAQKYRQKYVAYLNCVCAQDAFVFDGGSFVMRDGLMETKPVRWRESNLQFSTDEYQILCDTYELKKSCILNLNDSACEEVYNAICLSLMNYAMYAKCSRFVLGLSGGVDSALVAVIAAKVFGPQNVLCVAMPSRYSSDESLIDAEELVQNIGCELRVISLENIHQSFECALQDVIGTLKEDDIASENLQPRIRATLLMAIANQQNRLLLSTSNKSESAVGYTTLYGDMAGAFAPICDLYKTQVYALSRWMNRNEFMIPNNILLKEPSAELKSNQKDSDSLPVYDILDKILYSLIELRFSIQQIVAELHVSEDDVQRVKSMIHRNEFKRHQAPIGPKINGVMFNTDRRYSICSMSLNEL